MEIHQIISADGISSLKVKESEFLSLHKDFKLSFRRYFLSSREQKNEFGDLEGAISFVIQPVLGEDTVAVWLCLVKDSPVEYLWSANMHSLKAGSEAQTREILESYEASLADEGLSIADGCVRTWIYVDDIDNEYAGMVKARRENFEAEGMTKDSHYLASTGIFGGAVVPGSIVQIDALAIKGRFSQHYLYAPANFNPTHEYGVTFERGVVLEFGGEAHTLISGTASINNKGEIVHPGDVVRQAQRMLENVKALLDEAGNRWDDVKMAVVYLRNASDHEAVLPLIEAQFSGKIPFVITHAPVCRPGWLIEMECIAIR